MDAFNTRITDKAVSHSALSAPWEWLVLGTGVSGCSDWSVPTLPERLGTTAQDYCRTPIPCTMQDMYSFGCVLYEMLSGRCEAGRVG